MKLDDYFDAYDKTHDLAGGAPDWGTLRKKVRRSLARPALELAGQVVFLLARLAMGIRDLSSVAELQQHLDKEPPFPRPPVRPNGSFRGLPHKANS